MSDLQPLWPFLVYFLATLALVATMLVLSWLLGQRRANEATNMPFESGILSVGSPQIPVSAEFYLVAIFFVIFDLETVFIFAWAVAFFDLGWQGYVAVALFIAVLAVALVYELSTGALDWGIKTRRPPPGALSAERGALSAGKRALSAERGALSEKNEALSAKKEAPNTGKNTISEAPP